MSQLSQSTHSTEALNILMQPDGYYKYLNVPKPPPNQAPKSSQDDSIDKSKIEKNYRKLSLKLHPDRNGGDSEAFRLLERAKTVLLSDKLRKGYDLLGLDLEEDDHHDDDHHHDNGEKGEMEEKKDEAHHGSSTDSVMSHMASSTVAAILQLAIRTAMMAMTSVFVVRYKYLALIGILFLLYTAFQIKRASLSNPNIVTSFDILSPMLIASGVAIMYVGRGVEENNYWTKTFWIGEALIMTMFCLNTLAAKESSALRPNIVLGIGIYIVFAIVALLLRGKGWRYLTLLGIEMMFALAAVLIFPIMEMILEEIMNEKLRKVGDRVRLYNKHMEESYKQKIEELNARIPKSADKVVDTPVKSKKEGSHDLD